MDPDIIKNKLESLHRCLSRIKTHTPASVSELEDNIDAQDIIILNLERTVQLCVDIGSHILTDVSANAVDTMASVFTELAKNKIISNELSLNLARAVGFRNIAVHEYSELDWNIVYAIITRHLDDFYEFGRIVLGFLK